MMFLKENILMKAVYYICNNKNWGHVAAKVWELLEKEGVRFKANGCADIARFMWEEIL